MILLLWIELAFGLFLAAAAIFIGINQFAPSWPRFLWLLPAVFVLLYGASVTQKAWQAIKQKVGG